MDSNEVMITHSTFHMNSSSTIEEWHPSFNKEVIKSTKERKAAAIIDAATKDDCTGGS